MIVGCRQLVREETRTSADEAGRDVITGGWSCCDHDGEDSGGEGEEGGLVSDVSAGLSNHGGDGRYVYALDCIWVSFYGCLSMCFISFNNGVGSSES